MPKPQPLPPGATAALACLSLSVLLSSLGTSIANVGLPSLARAFGASFQQVQWVVLAYLLAITTLVVSVGRLGDLLGRRRLLLAGMAVFALASVLCAMAPSLALLVAARALQGLGAATMMALGMALVGESVPKERTGSAMGLLGTMSAVGTALGPSLGGLLLAAAGWRALFAALVPLGGVAMLMAWRYVPDSPAAARPRQPGFDRLGTLLLTLTLACYALAVTPSSGQPGAASLALLLAAALGAGLFVWVQARVRAPLVPLAALREPVLATSLALNAVVATVMMATLVVGPFFLSQGLGLGAAAVGAVMAVGPVISTLCGVPAGRAVDRWGAPAVVLAGLLAMVAGALGLALLPALWGLAGYLLGVAVLTPGYQLFQAANNTAVMADVPAERRGVVSGLLNLARNLGLITGASVMGAVFAGVTAAPDLRTAPPAALLGGMQATFGVAAGLLVLAWGVAAKGRRAPA